MKKHLIILLILALLLPGCAIDPTPTTPPTTAPQQTEPVAEGCGGHESDPYVNVNKESFYANYTPACCLVDATYRSQHFLLSGRLEVPQQFVTVSDVQPSAGSMLLRNTDRY